MAEHLKTIRGIFETKKKGEYNGEAIYGFRNLE